MTASAGHLRVAGAFPCPAHGDGMTIGNRIARTFTLLFAWSLLLGSIARTAEHHWHPTFWDYIDAPIGAVLIVLTWVGSRRARRRQQ